MRPRINVKFGTISRDELFDYLNDNAVYGFTAKVLEHTIIYSFHMMFRNLRKQPELIYVEVSRNTKNVVKAYSETGKQFNTVDELKRYVKR